MAALMGRSRSHAARATLRGRRTRLGTTDGTETRLILELPALTPHGRSGRMVAPLKGGATRATRPETAAQGRMRPYATRATDATRRGKP